MRDRFGDKIRLQHILDAIEAIEDYTAGVTYATFAENQMMLSATLHQLEVIGEASNRLSEALLLEHGHIPWARIIGLRNFIVHEYFGIDDKNIWNIITYNLPVFKNQIKSIVEKYNVK